MFPPNLSALRKPRLLRFLVVALLMILGLIVVPLPLRVSAAISSVAPEISGPLVPTVPFVDDNEHTTPSGNYERLLVYGWAVDPLLSPDTNNDYFIVFISATVEGGGDWCVADGSPNISPTENVILTVHSGTILPEISPMTGDHGQQTGSVSFGLTVGVSADIPVGPATITPSLSASLSWEQFIFQWDIQSYFSTTESGGRELNWYATVHPGGCSGAAWTFGYGAAIKSAKGESPTVGVALFGAFYKANDPSTIDCGGDVSHPNVGCTNPSDVRTLMLPPAVAFETNPILGSIALNGTQFVHGQHAFYGTGIYSATASSPEDYIFAHWQVEGGLGLGGQSPKSNPIAVNVTGNGVLKAVFAAKLTFLTDPPDVGSISISGAGGTGCGSGSVGSASQYSNGDWTYFSALPPDPSVGGLDQPRLRVCANTPAGYRFDHWSSTAQFVGVDSPVDPTVVIALSGPSAIKAWFSPLMSTPPSQSAPSAPSSLVATGQYGHVDLTWNLPLSDGGAQITSYQIYRGNSFSSLSPLTSVDNQLWYQDTSVTDGQIYYYRVTAINSAGEGPSSNTDSARPGIDRITITPDPRSVLTGAQVQLSAFARAESGEIIQGVSFSWTTSVPGASITNAGLFKAGTIVGTFTEEVSASAADVNGYATVIVQAPPSTRAGTANLSFDSLGPWTWALIPGAVAAVVGVLGVVVYRKRINRRLTKPR